MTTGQLPSAALEQLLEAVIAVGGQLRLPVVLRRIVEAATGLVGASYGALGVLDDDGKQFKEFIYIGLNKQAADRIGRDPRGAGVLGELIRHPVPIRIDDVADHPASAGFPEHHPTMHSFLGVPITVRDQVFGNLYLTDKRDGRAFTAVDEQLMVALASAAAMAIENARLHSRVSDLVVVEDRERIARELHDTVIQRIFATGLALQGLVEICDDDELGRRLSRAVDDLDDTVRDIRTTIFELQRPLLPGRSLRSEIVDLAVEIADAFDFTVAPRFAGPVDTALDGVLAEELLAVSRELLTNVGKHAGATRADLTLTVANREIELLVIDNGQGLAEGDDEADDLGLGLGNIEARSTNRGGTTEVISSPGAGVTVIWRIPQP